MSALKYQNHASLSSYAPPSEPLVGFTEDDSIGAADLISMCSLLCIPWHSFLVKSSSEQEGDTVVRGEQEFQVIATTEEKQEISKISKSEEDLATYDSVPAWKRKYIARKSAGMDDSSSSSRSSSSHGSSTKRTALEETLDRCRNIEDTSITLHGDDEVEEQEEEASSSAGSWMSFFSLGLGGHVASTSPSTSLYSKVLGTTDVDADKIDSSLNSLSLGSSSSSSSYDSNSPASRKGKLHRRQQSPSGVMDLVVESE